jgi:hypothetical protein
MNIQTHPENNPLNHYVFRAADRMRIDGCANAVAHEGLSLALYCPFEALLDHYVNLLLSRLRQQAPDHRMEVYFPANTDGLLGRFNEVLASQSLNEAIKTSSTTHPTQIWLVHDAQNLPDSELQLLARLIQNFPGANIRAILLKSGATHAAQTSLSAFGRKILRWDIEAPTEEQAQAALEQARQEGNFSAVQQLIQRIRRQQLPELDMPLHAPVLSANVASTQNEPNQTRASTDTKKINAFEHPDAVVAHSQKGLHLRKTTNWLQRLIKLALGIAFMLVLSMLVMLWIQPEAFGLKSAKPVAAATGKSPELVSTLLPPTEPTASPANAPHTQATMAVTPTEPAIEAPEVALQAQAWLKQLDAGSFLLQHGIDSSYEKILDIQRKHPALKDAQIIAAYRPGEKLAHFVLVSGPFDELNQGHEASKRPGIPRSWVRPTRSLQEMLKNPT